MIVRLTPADLPIFDRALIGGRWVMARSGAAIEVRNPANHEFIGVVSRCGPAETAAAVDAAAGALPAWRSLPGLERARLLRRLHELMLRDLAIGHLHGWLSRPSQARACPLPRASSCWERATRRR